jgi:CRISPR system Cascade subunit CasE
MTTLHLSRLRLRQAPSAAALARVLLPDDADARTGAAHRLIWSLFADTPDRTRDFLWREDGDGAWHRKSFLVLSARPPHDAHDLFDLETKPFAPVLAPGQLVRFRLRASPSASEARPYGERGKRIDPLARALRGLSTEARRAERDAVTQKVGAEWLAAQGARAGFRLAEEPDEEETARLLVRVDGDHWHALRRESGGPIRYSSLDFEGVLVVDDPGRFLTAVAQGFGRAKAFGCGLMLIRRA